MDSSPQVAVQLRLSFPSPVVPATLSLGLVHNRVQCRIESSAPQVVLSQMRAAGMKPVVEQDDIWLSLSDLGLLARLPAHLAVAPDLLLAPLVVAATDPPAPGTAALLSVEDEQLVLDWQGRDAVHRERLQARAAGALLECGLPFTATPSAWGAVSALSNTPVRLGVARMNTDGFIEISSALPQIAEEAPIRGLFRIDASRFGVCAAFADDIDQAAGIEWAHGQRPSAERAPLLPALPIEVSAHAAQELSRFTVALSTLKAQAVVWDSGLGRRVFTLLALWCLDAFPVQVVTTPAGVWAWQRHCELLGLTHTLTGDPHAEVHIVTYLDLAQRSHLVVPAAIVFDEVTGDEGGSVASASAVRCFDGVQALRVGVCSSWPTDLAAQLRVMSALRPEEFPADGDVARRYPHKPHQRGAEHVQVYVSRRERDPGTSQRAATEMFRSSSVQVLSPAKAQLEAFTDIRARRGDAGDWATLQQLLVATTRGTDTCVGPKLVAACAAASAAAVKGDTVALVVRAASTGQMLAGLLRPLRVQVLPAGSSDATVARVRSQMSGGGVAVVCLSESLPNLRCFDQVVVVDYPYSMLSLEDAVGAANEDDAVFKVTVLHLADSVDDRLAVLAARRLEEESTAAPTIGDINYVLHQRYGHS